MSKPDSTASGSSSTRPAGIEKPDARPGIPNLLAINRVAYQTIVRKEIRRFARIWVQTIVPPAVNALLYMVIFGTLIGSRISEMDGFRYIDFIVPGLIMMAVIVNSYSNVVSSFFSAKMQNYIEELLVSPVSNITIVAGYLTGGMARGLLVGTLVASVSLFLVISGRCTRLSPYLWQS